MGPEHTCRALLIYPRFVSETFWNFAEACRRGSASTLLLVTNAHHDLVLFTLPAVKGGRDWVGRSQSGNNNAYCQHNEISWVNWDHDEGAVGLIDFVRYLASLRRRYPVRRQARFLTASWNDCVCGRGKQDPEG